MLKYMSKREAKRIVRKHGKNWKDLMNRHFTPEEQRAPMLYRICENTLYAFVRTKRCGATEVRLVGNV